MPSRVTFVFGGAASGKSEFAEDLVINAGKPKVYLATSQVFDHEMQTKVDIHKSRRNSGWTTVEEPLALAPALANLPPDAICLLDCATMWLSNHLLNNSDLRTEQDRLVDAIANCPADLVIVSNEVGMGIVPDNTLSRQFREAQGRLNIALAKAADTVVFVAAGLPLVMKGSLT